MGEGERTLHLAQALTSQGWLPDVRLAVCGGKIGALTSGVAPQVGDERHAIALPGVPNLHSHAFQRAMAGLAEVRGTSADSFWSWREAMYRLALKMSPEQVEAVAAQLYVEMLEAGFTRVGEFHYLHHGPDGRAYADVAEMATRIAAAAQDAGIGLTLLPVFYAHAGFGGAPPDAAQRRFVSDIDGFARLLQGCRLAVRGLDGASLGVAPHSLRAVTPGELAALCALAPSGPLHIHIAEQIAEVDACLAWSGARPVAWLLDHAPVNERWCLVHATHMTAQETRRMAASGAVAGLCPVTEANLGDGVFNAPEFFEAGGRFGVGTDSNVSVGVADELRQLEYAQRLTRRARNVMALSGGSTGRALFDRALLGGVAALASAPVGLALGADADLVTLDASHPLLAARAGDALLDAWIFGGQAMIDCVFVRGRKIVAGGAHVGRGPIREKFNRAMAALRQT